MAAPPVRKAQVATTVRAPGTRRAWLGWLWRAAAAVVLLLVFLAYAQPSLMQHLADQLWACF